jgi:hypothetical protein
MLIFVEYAQKKIILVQSLEQMIMFLDSRIDDNILPLVAILTLYSSI